MHDELGNWICCCMKNGISGQGNDTDKVLVECGVSVDILWEQWALQRTAQLLLHACKYVAGTILLPTWWFFLDAPARLKKGLDTILALQADLDAVNSAIQLTHLALSKANHASTIASLNILSVIGLKIEYPWIIHFSLILYSNWINMINIKPLN